MISYEISMDGGRTWTDAPDPMPPIVMGRLRRKGAQPAPETRVVRSSAEPSVDDERIARWNAWNYCGTDATETGSRPPRPWRAPVATGIVNVWQNVANLGRATGIDGERRKLPTVAAHCMPSDDPELHIPDA